MVTWYQWVRDKVIIRKLPCKFLKLAKCVALAAVECQVCHPDLSLLPMWVQLNINRLYWSTQSAPLNERNVSRKKRIWIWKIYMCLDCLGKISCLSCSTGTFNFDSKSFFHRIICNFTCISMWKTIFQVKLYKYSMFSNNVILFNIVLL